MRPFVKVLMCMQMNTAREYSDDSCCHIMGHVWHVG